MDFHHYDFYSQALAKIQRNDNKDRQDVESMRTDGLLEPYKLFALLDEVERHMIRYPALDLRAIRQRLSAWLQP